MQQVVDSDISRIEISDLAPIKILGDLRWTGKAKFPKALRPRAIVVFQLADNVVAISAFCPHEQASLAEARFVEPFVLECPLHQNRYDLRTGVIKTFHVELEGEQMYLLWRRGAGEPVAPTFGSAVKLAQRTLDERHQTLQHELLLQREATTVREAHMVTTLEQMDGMIREVEDKRRLIEASLADLTKANELIARVTNSMSEILVVLDQQGRVSDVNARFQRLLGFSKDSVVGSELARFVALEASAAQNTPLDPQLLRGLREGEVDAYLVSATGERIEHLLRIAPLYGRSGKRDGAVVVGTDIHDLKLTQRQLGDAYAKVSNLLDNMRQAVFVVLASGEIVEPVSRFSEQVFGRPIVNKNIFDVLYSDIPPASELHDSIRSVFEISFGAGAFQWELVCQLLPSRVVQKIAQPDVAIFKVEYCPLYDANGVVERLMLIVEDITKLESLELGQRVAARRTQILEELLANRPEDLRVFLSDAAKQLRSVRALLERDETDAPTGILRQLHTLKGNARVLGLRLVAQAVHEAENVVSHQSQVSREDAALQAALRPNLREVQRELNEYSALATRVLHLPNDLEAQALADLHVLVSALDADLPELIGALDTPEQNAVGLRMQRTAASARDAAEVLGSDETSQAASLLERALNHLVCGDKPASTHYISELLAAHETLVCSAIQRRMEAATQVAYSLATRSWVALFLACYDLSHSADRPSHDAHSLLRLERDRERATSAASALKADYAGLLIAQSAAASASSARDNVGDLLRELWRYLALHATLESLCTCRQEERHRLMTALAVPHMADARFNALLESGDMRGSSWVGFLGAQRRDGSSLQVVQDNLCRWLAVTDVASLPGRFFAANTPEQLTSLLDAVHAHTKADGFDAWALQLGAASGVFTDSSPVTPSYLKRLDVLRLARTTRDLLLGNFHSLVDRVPTVEMMKVHFDELQRKLGEYRRDRSDSALDAIELSVKRLLDVPVMPALHKYHAMVREIANQLGKDVTLQIRGDDATALPREQLHGLQDALVHLVRNSLDHGLELPSERLAQGKSSKGNIVIECRANEDATQIVLRDDGRGIDPARVKAKALELRLIDPGGAAQLSEREAIELIFLPHFSTAGAVTDISGRGIGMDVVRESVVRLGATLSVESRVGHGTEFMITVPRAWSTKGE